MKRRGAGDGVRARQENAHCDGEVWGTKEATGSVWHCTEQTDPPFVSHPLVRRPHNFLSSLVSFPSRPCFKRTSCPTLASSFGVVKKRNERESGELVVLCTC